MADTNTTNRKPDEIERDVRRTQDEIGETLDKIEEKMTPREVSRSLLGDDGTEVARDALEVTRTNPIPVALIAIGVIWLIASSNSPAVRRVADRVTGKRSGKMDLRARSEEPAPIGPFAGETGEEMNLRPRSDEPAPIGPPPATGETFDRRGF